MWLIAMCMCGMLYVVILHDVLYMYACMYVSIPVQKNVSIDEYCDYKSN